MPMGKCGGLRGIGVSAIFIHILTKRLVRLFSKCRKDRSLDIPLPCCPATSAQPLDPLPVDELDHRWGAPLPNLLRTFTSQSAANRLTISLQWPRFHHCSTGSFFDMCFKSAMEPGPFNHLFALTVQIPSLVEGPLSRPFVF